MYKIEDALTLHVSKACGGIPCGRITTEGRREFYFYGETKEGFVQAVRAAMGEFKHYRFDTGEREDSKWEQYLTVLYPSIKDLQRIANMDLLDVIIKRGDVLTIPREVQHWMYFPSNVSREQFRESAKAAGFVISSEFTSDGDLPFAITVTRTQSIEQKFIDATVLELLDLSLRFDGSYDGWETPIKTQ